MVKMRKASTILFAVAMITAIGASAEKHKEKHIKTTFQTSQPWRPTMDNRADAVMIYGIRGDVRKGNVRERLHSRIQSWRDRGYVTHYMTGIAWGEYQDYFSGAWDGRTHWEDGQVRENGDTIWHGPGVPYIVPTDNYLRYIKETRVRPIIDEGITSIFMEEPEFWNWGGYSEAFKREWKKFYGFDWRPQHTSPENTYLANKLKYHLYYNALREVFTYAKEYGRQKGLDVKCYVPTHSLLNYAQWHIVSPEASLASLDCVDGYIAQVWTGTARESNHYNGRERERCFEGAFLEYGCMASMTEPTGRKMFFLTDPIEDWPRDWADYKRNYEATFSAQLLYPRISDYEVMPWPERIYEGLYPVSANSKEKARIPQHYATQMQVMVNSLQQMPRSENHVCGSHGISVMMANSLMFQRFPTHDGYEDPKLSNFFGLTMPLLKRGIPVGITHLENVGYEEALRDVKVLVMTYANMKPMDKEAHEHLHRWVKKGGTLVYVGRDDDPFQQVMEWWNTDGNDYACPSAHLFELFDLKTAPAESGFQYGKGHLYVMRRNPKEFVLQQGGDKDYMQLISYLYEKVTGKELETKNYLHLQRGMYEICATMDESVSSEPYMMEGLFVDLFDPALPVITRKSVQPGTQAYLINMERVKNKRKPQVLAAAYRASDEVRERHAYSYVAKGPQDIVAPSRVLLPSKPVKVTVNGQDVTDVSCWNEESKTYMLQVNNSPDGLQIRFEW